MLLVHKFDLQTKIIAILYDMRIITSLINARFIEIINIIQIKRYSIFYQDFSAR